MTVGIIGYGAHIPRRRIKVEEIAKVWGADAPSYKRGLELLEKSVPALDEDTITLSVEAARNAIARAGIDPKDIGAVYVGTFEMGVTFVTWLTALRLSRTTAQVGNLIFLTPFFSLFFIRYAVGETILQSTLVGLTLIVVGIVLQQRYGN